MQGAAGHGPRLRMGHLLLWVVGCSIGFAVVRPLTQANLPTDRYRLMLFSSLVMGIALGTILTGCGLTADRRWRGDRSYPSRAGHWLLLRALAVYATWRIFLLPRSPTSASVGELIVDLAFLWYLRAHLPRRWVAVFLVPCIAAAIRAALFMELGRNPAIVVSLNGVSAGSALVDALVVLWAIGRDRRSGVPTDGLHRLGIATALALDAWSAIVSLASLLR